MTPKPRIYVEDWEPTYGSPYQVGEIELVEESATLEEDGSALRSHAVAPALEPPALAFVDGIRRGEAWLFVDNPATGTSARALAGAFAVGAVLVAGDPARLSHCDATRIIVWGSGLEGELPAAPGNWTWLSVSVADREPDAPLQEHQRRMREAEAGLAERLADDGYLVVVDGTLHLLRSRDRSVIGYVKTHHRALLSADLHRRIPQLPFGQRTSIFRVGEHRYSAYFRLAAARSFSSPWSGIVRLEASQSPGLEKARTLIDKAAAELPRFAGVPHRDPRAPQNLQPIGRLEDHLRHLLGSPRLATRAVRDTVAGLSQANALETAAL